MQNYTKIYGIAHLLFLNLKFGSLIKVKPLQIKKKTTFFSFKTSL